MNTANLLDAQAWLCCALLENPTLAAASAAAWLDPFLLLSNADWIDDDLTDTGDVMWAARMCRDNFPEIYARVLHAPEASVKTLGQLFLDALVKLLPQTLQRHIFDLEQLRGGPPAVCFGFDLEDSEFYERHDNFQRLARLFGIRSEEDGKQIVKACEVARKLIHSLNATRIKRYRDLANTLSWLFSLTGATVLDLTNEDLYENGLEGPAWDDLEFLREIYQEVDDFKASARRTFKALKTDKALLQALKDNIRRGMNATTTHKPEPFDWPKAAGRGARQKR